MATSASDHTTKKPSDQQDMKLIDNKTSRMAAFCKRRTGLFKKANELCTLCAAQMALIIFSPTNKPYAYGHPDVNSVMEEYLAQTGTKKKISSRLLEQVKNSPTAENLCNELAQVKMEFKAYKKSGDDLAKTVNANKNKSWWKKSIADMSLLELEECKKAMEELMAIVHGDMGSSSTVGKN